MNTEQEQNNEEQSATANRLYVPPVIGEHDHVVLQDPMTQEAIIVHQGREVHRMASLTLAGPKAKRMHSLIVGETVREFVEERVNGWRLLAEMQGLEVTPPYQDTWLLEHAQIFEWAPRPKYIEDGLIKSCYYNAYELAKNDDSLIYCEGMAFSGGFIPVMHAWVIDKETETVIDNTWDRLGHFNKPGYFGVPFKTEYVAKIYDGDEDYPANDGYGLIDNWEAGYPIFNGDHKPEEFLHELSEFWS